MIMEIISSSIAILLLTSFVQNLPQDQQLSNNGIRRQSTNSGYLTCRLSCSNSNRPVCDSCGRTHQNECFFNEARCRAQLIGDDLQMSDGACRSGAGIRKTNLCTFLSTNRLPILSSSSQQQQQQRILAAVNSNRDGGSSCDRPCPNDFLQVCDSEGGSYQNDCYFKTAVCYARAVGRQLTRIRCPPGGGPVVRPVQPIALPPLSIRQEIANRQTIPFGVQEIPEHPEIPLLQEIPQLTEIQQLQEIPLAAELPHGKQLPQRLIPFTFPPETHQNIAPPLPPPIPTEIQTAPALPPRPLLIQTKIPQDISHLQELRQIQPIPSTHQQQFDPDNLPSFLVQELPNFIIQQPAPTPSIFRVRPRSNCHQIRCPRRYRSVVCDNLGNRYTNLCQLQIAQCEADEEGPVSFSLYQAPCPSSETGRRGQNEIFSSPSFNAIETCRPARECPVNYAPVCDSNGDTYNNECQFRAEQCLKTLSGNHVILACRQECPCNSVPGATFANNGRNSAVFPSSFGGSPFSRTLQDAVPIGSGSSSSSVINRPSTNNFAPYRGGTGGRCAEGRMNVQDFSRMIQSYGPFININCKQQFDRCVKDDPSSRRPTNQRLQTKVCGTDGCTYPNSCYVDALSCVGEPWDGVAINCPYKCPCRSIGVLPASRSNPLRG